MRRLLLVLIVASAFGPYLGFGIRTDQVVVYLLAAGLVLLAPYRLRLPGPALLVVAAWAVYATVALVALAAPPIASRWGPGSALANLDNLALPAATLLVVLAIAHGGDLERLRQAVTTTAAAGVMVAAVVGVVQYLAPGLVAPLVLRFVGSGDTAERASTLGRLTGILGQPSAAGSMYTLGILCAIYAFRRRPVVQTIAITVITVGGILTVSKGFLLVGLPIAAWLLIRTRGRAGQRVVIGAAAAGLYVAATTLGLVATWSGWERVTRLIPGLGTADARLYTGNRYGQGSSTQPLIDATLDADPLAGFGIRGVATATDTLFVQALVLAGLIGVGCVVVVLAAVAATAWRRRNRWELDVRRLYLPVTLALVVLSVGSPALTANRVSVVAWTLLALLIADRGREEAPVSTGEVETGAKRAGSEVRPSRPGFAAR